MSFFPTLITSAREVNWFTYNLTGMLKTCLMMLDDDHFRNGAMLRSVHSPMNQTRSSMQPNQPHGISEYVVRPADRTILSNQIKEKVDRVDQFVPIYRSSLINPYKHRCTTRLLLASHVWVVPSQYLGVRNLSQAKLLSHASLDERSTSTLAVDIAACQASQHGISHALMLIHHLTFDMAPKFPDQLFLSLRGSSNS